MLLRALDLSLQGPSLKCLRIEGGYPVTLHYRRRELILRERVLRISSPGDLCRLAR